LGLLYRLRNGYRSGVMGGSLWVTLMKRCFTTLWKSQSIFRFFSIIFTHPRVGEKGLEEGYGYSL
jgi:hypothetical protein